MSLPLVSIITVTRNRASLITRCIESIQNQSYKNYEHIIVDGASSDNTQDVVLRYGDPKIVYKKLNTYGHKAQLQAAFDLSKGEYIAFLDDDDEYTINGLEKRVMLLDRLPSNYGFVYASMDYYDDQSKQFLYRRDVSIPDGGPEDLAAVIAQPKVCGAPTLLFRREAYYSVSGGTWVNDAGNDGADFLLCAVCVKRGWRFHALRECTAKVYVNHDAVRLTNSWTSGKDGILRSIQYSEFILKEFSDALGQHNSAGELYYSNLLYDYIRIGCFQKAFVNYIKLIKCCCSFKNLLRLPHAIWLKLRH